MTPDSSGLYVVARLDDGGGNGRVVLLRKDLYGSSDEDDEEDEDEDPEASPMKTRRRGSGAAELVVVDLTPHVASPDETPGSIAVSKDFVFVAVSDGVLIVDAAAGAERRRVLGKLELVFKDGSSLTSITLGEDGYLYLTTRDQLLRVRVQQRPVMHSTDRVPKRAIRASF
jgi:glucose/arabinose dehydrogenase